jgi:hypothetical protein
MQVVLEDIKRTLRAEEVCLPSYPDKQPILSKGVSPQVLHEPEEVREKQKDLRALSIKGLVEDEIRSMHDALQDVHES